MISKYKKIVIKIGSSSIINSKTKKINSNFMSKLCQDLKKYHKEKKIIIVCSGAIALGQSYLKIKRKKMRTDALIIFRSKSDYNSLSLWGKQLKC